VVTAGHACPELTCPYYGVTDTRVHALIGYGHHGTTDRIQDFLCQACGTKVSARTPAMAAGLTTHRWTPAGLLAAPCPAVL
jgi:hypothetical protein